MKAHYTKFDLDILPGDPGTILCKLEPKGVLFDVSRYQVPERIPRMVTELPDGTKTTVVDVTEKLEASLPREDIRIGLSDLQQLRYGHCIIDVFKVSMGIDADKAETFAKH